MNRLMNYYIEGTQKFEREREMDCGPSDREDK